ncbi:MAG: endonuclease/exonuclease/phosphatase family protein [Sphingorhabdus sp.]
MSKAIKVATYNIRKCVGLDRKRNPQRIIDVLNEIDADIIALQEADHRFGARDSCLPAQLIEDETPWKPVPLGVRPKGIGWHGNAILVRENFAIRDARPLDLPMLEPRGAVVAEIETAHGPMRVIGAHLDISGLWRRRQIKAMLAYLDNAPRHIPTVIMGDFNQWSNRGALSEFAFHHHRILKTPKSFHTTKPVAKLDRIIVCQHLSASDVGCHDSALAKKASDHLPIWAQLGIA